MNQEDQTLKQQLNHHDWTWEEAIESGWFSDFALQLNYNQLIYRIADFMAKIGDGIVLNGDGTLINDIISGGRELNEFLLDLTRGARVVRVLYQGVNPQLNLVLTDRYSEYLSGQRTGPIATYLFFLEHYFRDTLIYRYHQGGMVHFENLLLLLTDHEIDDNAIFQGEEILYRDLQHLGIITSNRSATDFDIRVDCTREMRLFLTHLIQFSGAAHYGDAETFQQGVLGESLNSIFNESTRLNIEPAIKKLNAMITFNGYSARGNNHFSVSLRSDQTVDQLHQEITQINQFDPELHYALYNGEITQYGIEFSPDMLGGDPDKIALWELGLYTGKQLYYLLDFGDEEEIVLVIDSIGSD